MDSPSDDLDISQLSAIELHRQRVTMAQVRAVYAAPLKTFSPDETSFAGVYHFAGLLNDGRILSVALAYAETTGRITALGSQVVIGIRELRSIFCG